MRDSTLIQPKSVPAPCLTDEALAAYIDGGLGPGESQQVAEHLADCEDCFDLYSETARFLVDSSPASPEEVAREAALAGKGVVRFPSLAERRRQVVQWVAIAALLLLGVGGGGWFQFLAAPPALTTIADKVPNQAALIPQLKRGPTYRGENPGEEGISSEASFRMGVQVINLSITLRAGEGKEAEDVVARIHGILKDQSFTDDLRKRYLGITSAIESQKTPQSLLPVAAKLAQESREVFDTTSLDLGQWVAGGRLATLAKDPAFFRQGDNRKFLRRLLWRDKLGWNEMKLDLPTRAALEQISDALPSGDPQPSDYAKLRPLFDKILEIYYPET